MGFKSMPPVTRIPSSVVARVHPVNGGSSLSPAMDRIVLLWLDSGEEGRGEGGIPQLAGNICPPHPAFGHLLPPSGEKARHQPSDAPWWLGTANMAVVRGHETASNQMTLLSM